MWTAIMQQLRFKTHGSVKYDRDDLKRQMLMTLLTDVVNWDKEMEYLNEEEMGLQDFIEKHLMETSVGDAGILWLTTV